MTDEDPEPAFPWLRDFDPRSGVPKPRERPHVPDGYVADFEVPPRSMAPWAVALAIAVFYGMYDGHLTLLAALGVASILFRMEHDRRKFRLRLTKEGVTIDGDEMPWEILELHEGWFGSTSLRPQDPTVAGYNPQLFDTAVIRLRQFENNWRSGRLGGELRFICPELFRPSPEGGPQQ